MSEIIKFIGKGVCDIHGEYEYQGRRIGATLLGKFCSKCEAEKDVSRLAKRKKDEEEMEREKRIQRLNNAGVPEHFHTRSFDTYQVRSVDMEKMLNLMRKYVSRFDRVLASPNVSGFIITGGYGTGKTHIGCSAVSALIDAGYSAKYISCSDFLIKVKDAQNFKSHDRTYQLISDCLSPDLLVVDEFGSHSTTDLDFQVMFSIIDGRYQKNLPTFLITNMTSDLLMKYIDNRIYERITSKEGGVLAFNWYS